MKSVRLVETHQPLQMQEVPIPTVRPSDVLVRVRAAGICHTDVHYRGGKSKMALPITLGHEIAGVVEQTGAEVQNLRVGDRVCLHYLLTCGVCSRCARGHEQFCHAGAMLGHGADGGYAEYIAVPERNAVKLPDAIPFQHAAIMMCSSATALHALRKSRLQAGESVAIFGIGGLGVSAIQLARAMGALDVYAVDIQPSKLQLAQKYGAIPINAKAGDPVQQILDHTQGEGVDASIEMIGLQATMRQSVQCLGKFGRAVVAGIGNRELTIDPYRELLGKEAEVIGSNDHLLGEIPVLIEFALRGKLDLSEAVTRTIPLEETGVNEVLDSLESFAGGVRTVVVP